MKSKKKGLITSDVSNRTSERAEKKRNNKEKELSPNRLILNAPYFCYTFRLRLNV